MTLPSAAAADLVTFTVTMTPEGAGTEGSGGTGSGSGVVTLDTVTNIVTYDISFSGLSDQEYYTDFVGRSFPGFPLPTAYVLAWGPNKSGSVQLVDLFSGFYPIANQIEDFMTGAMRVNVRTNTFQDGEIRGVLVPGGLEQYLGLLDPQQAGSTGSGGGNALLTLNDFTLELDYAIDFGGLSGNETQAHLHGPALAGAAAPVLYNLPLGSPKAGTLTLVDLSGGSYTTAQQVADLDAGLWYVDIHSDAHPAGEIRAQLASVLLELTASLDPVQAETVPIGGTGSGVANVTLNQLSGELIYDISYSGLSDSETKIHIHGPSDFFVGAGILYDLPVSNPALGLINLTPLKNGAYSVQHQVDDAKQGLWYINVHSNSLRGGEIRGQLGLVP